MSVTAASYYDLKRCYVFAGYMGIKKEIEKMRAEYTGSVLSYWEYETILRRRYRTKGGE